MPPTDSELLAIATAGGGLVVNAAVLTPAVCLALATAAARGGGSVRFISAETMAQSQRLAISTAGKGRAILDFTV